MSGLLAFLDFAIVSATLISAWLWWRSGHHILRRVRRGETLDAADINRVIVALNRMQMLNSRAALVTALAAALAAVRFAIGMVSKW